MRVLRAGGPVQAPLDAAAQFHAEVVPAARAALAAGEDLLLVLSAADHAHRGWRLAAVQELAREAAPLRVNAIAGEDVDAIAAAQAYLAGAPGVTGQLLALDGTGAGAMLYQPG